MKCLKNVPFLFGMSAAYHHSAVLSQCSLPAAYLQLPSSRPGRWIYLQAGAVFCVVSGQPGYYSYQQSNDAMP